MKPHPPPHHHPHHPHQRWKWGICSETLPASPDLAENCDAISEMHDEVASQLLRDHDLDVSPRDTVTEPVESGCFPKPFQNYKPVMISATGQDGFDLEHGDSERMRPESMGLNDGHSGVKGTEEIHTSIGSVELECAEGRELGQEHVDELVCVEAESVDLLENPIQPIPGHFLKSSQDYESERVSATGQQMPELPVWEEGGVDTLEEGSEDHLGFSESERLHLKRSPQMCLDRTPSVRVIYTDLTSESRKILKQLLRQWAEWQGSNKGEMEMETLTDGDEMYFPVLRMSDEKMPIVHFWMDKPSKKARMDQSTHESKICVSQEADEVPFYDRVCTTALLSQETIPSLEERFKVPREISRCFNCESHCHALKDCPRPWNNAAISSARKRHSENRVSAVPHLTSRYYQSSTGGKFDGLRPGELGSETRRSLGIGDLDPPPWLNRMRELGYPPGYLYEPSGITIYNASDDTVDGGYLGEDGEIIGDSIPVAQKMTVQFPGINAPIPDNADERLWAAPSGLSGNANSSMAVISSQNTLGQSTEFTSRYSAAAVTGHGTEHVGSGNWNHLSDAPPGTENEPPSNSHVRCIGGSLLIDHWYSNELSARPGKANGNHHLDSRSILDSERKCSQVSCDDGGQLFPYSPHAMVSDQSDLLHSPQPDSSIPQPNNSRDTMSQQVLSPRWGAPYFHDSRDDMTEARRKAWAQAYEALAAVRKN